MRFEVDPPEFLFGMDMNSNGVIDRFEDDGEADYPYKLGRQGFNTYAAVEILPRTTVMVGYLDQRLLDTARENQAAYLLLTAKKEFPEQDFSAWLIANPRGLKTTFPTTCCCGATLPGTRGRSVFTRDLLPARDAFVNTTYLEVHYDRLLPLTAKVKHEFYQQLGNQQDELRDQRFLGIVTKGEYSTHIRNWDPRAQVETALQQPGASPAQCAQNPRANGNFLAASRAPHQPQHALHRRSRVRAVQQSPPQARPPAFGLPPRRHDVGARRPSRQRLRVLGLRPDGQYRRTMDPQKPRRVTSFVRAAVLYHGVRGLGHRSLASYSNPTSFMR